LSHNVPDVFWNWMQKLDEQWVFAMGLPIAEPYWARFTVGGVERDLLVQLFERRVLTYNPTNESQWQVEMGNIGQHYYSWRYTGTTPVAGTTITPGTTTNPNPGSTPTSGTAGAGTPTSGTAGAGTPTSGTAGSGTPTSGTSGAGTPTTGTAGAGTPTSGAGTPTSGTPTPTPTPSTNQNDEEKKFVELINQYRSQNKLPALKVDDKLQQAARWLSEDMAKFNYFGHIDSKGRDYPKRFADFGYTGSPVNEIIAAGGAAQAAFDTWKSSPGNNALMLNPDFKVMGVGYATNTNSTYQYYWTTAFGG
jgi:uncharacterized protein YkwD